MNEKKESKEMAPCLNTDCVSYATYYLQRPDSLIWYNNFRAELIYCLFCDKFVRQDMFKGKE